MEKLYLGICLILGGTIIAGLGVVVPIMLGKYKAKWYRVVSLVTVTIGSVLGLAGLAIFTSAATLYHH